MAAAAVVSPLLSLEEYPHTAYEPDCKFVDGHLEERHLGELEHGQHWMQQTKRGT